MSDPKEHSSPYWTEGSVADCTRLPREKLRWPLRGIWGRRGEPEGKHFCHYALTPSCSSPTSWVDAGPLTFECPTLNSVLFHFVSKPLSLVYSHLPSPCPPRSPELLWLSPETSKHPPNMSVLYVNLLVLYDAWYLAAGLEVCGF